VENLPPPRPLSNIAVPLAPTSGRHSKAPKSRFFFNPCSSSLRSPPRPQAARPHRGVRRPVARLPWAAGVQAEGALSHGNRRRPSATAFATQLLGTRRDEERRENGQRSELPPFFSTLWNWLSQGGMVESEFRVRCIQPLCHLSKPRGPPRDPDMGSGKPLKDSPFEEFKYQLASRQKRATIALK
jgi:hypothetical protein